jgi:glycosyltransferase involved in cell wall biosynthesis
MSSNTVFSDKKPMLSIVMPFFNHEDMVAEMIDSIVANDFSDWELLAVDDGSTKEAADFLSHYADDDQRIHIIRRNREPKGAQTCRNMGLEAAQGKYTIFFDSDDYVCPYCLRQRVEAMEQHPGFDFMVFPSGTYQHGKFAIKAARSVYGYKIFKDDIAAFARKTLPFIVFNNIYLTSAIRDRGIVWDTRLLSLQDSDFNMQCILAGMSYTYADAKPDYGYRTEGNEASISKKVSSAAHRQSNLYHLEKQHREIQRVKGGQYNKYLYQGSMRTYNNMMVNGVEEQYANQLIEVVSRYSWYNGLRLKIKARTSILLAKFLSAKVARQIPMVIYLLHRQWIDRHIISKIGSIIDSSKGKTI